MMKYQVNSPRADEFIHDGEIMATLEYAKEHRNDKAMVDEILARAAERKGLSHREAAVLLESDDPEIVERIFKLAREIKNHIYGNRIVMFAPLYLSNYCINGCVYCPYHAKNKTIPRRKLTQEEICREVIALQDMGHKRLALETGEHPTKNPIEYVLESIDTIYSIHHKNGAIRRVNVNIAATTVENYRLLRDAGIGTYILFEETYNRKVYEALHPTEEILRIDAAVRRRLGFPAGKAQPWVMEDKPAEHTVTLEFTVHSDIDYENPFIALEDADIATIKWNGEAVTAAPDGYYVDLSIQKVALPPLRKGENTLTVTIPFAVRSNCEAMYLLGNFGVRVAGRRLTVTELPETVGFSDLTYQGLPFYGGAISYKIPVDAPADWSALLQVPHYTAAVNTVELDGEKRAVIAYPPYLADVGVIPAGKHELTVTSYITRRNCFGDVHDADEKLAWQGPSAWVTGGSSWTYEYRLRRTGVLTTPIILKKD